jgi:hypothetical protein
VVNATPRPIYHLKKTRYPLYRSLGGPKYLSEWLWKVSSPPGSDPQTVQPVASRYTDYAIPSLLNYESYFLHCATCCNVNTALVLCRELDLQRCHTCHYCVPCCVASYYLTVGLSKVLICWCVTAMCYC